jgi:uncharacterized protein YbjT (DUF2867 family)
VEVLVAGATGQLGRRVVSELRARGHRVRALGRDRAALAAVGADAAVVADALRAETLDAAVAGVDAVVSALGQSVAPRPLPARAPYRAVDLPANANLIAAARRAEVERFVYVSLFGAGAHRRLDYVDAHEGVVAALRASGLRHTVVRPTAFFGTLAELLPAARRGVAIVFGDGRARTNPIDEADLAAVCAEALEGDAVEVAAGGPWTYTRAEIGALALRAVGRRGRVLRLPFWVGDLIAASARPFDRRLAALLAFGVDVMRRDLVAPVRGVRSLEEYLPARAGALGRDVSSDHTEAG